MKKSTTIKNKDIKRRALALVDKYFPAAYEQVCRKGINPDLENIMIEMINIHYKRTEPLK